jgi:dolichyl-diphosphooligosaccharide--protein glycosyltransferase
LYEFHGVASVKTFERVEGATIIGQAENVTEPENVIAAVQMSTTNTDRSFLYINEGETDPDGSFGITVPYPTEDDVSVEEGGTNASVEANGPYNVFVGENLATIEAFGQRQIAGSEEQGLVNVTETDVYMGNEVEVELEETETPDDTNNTDSGEEDDTSAGNETDGEGTDGGNGTSDGTSGGNGGGTSDGSIQNGAETENGGNNTDGSGTTGGG